MSRGGRLVGAGVLVLTLALPGGTASAQASPFVPLRDAAYHDLDALVAAGLVRTLHAGQRPYSRLAFARAVREADGRLAAEPEPPQARTREALERLRGAFRAESARLCPTSGDVCASTGPGVRLREARLDVTWTDSPFRAIPTAYEEPSRIDGRVNPLLDRDLGRPRVVGTTAGLEPAVELDLGGHLSGFARPRGWAARPEEGSDELDGVLHEGYVRAVAGNWGLEVGRLQIVLGQSPDASVVVSGNARGLDAVRLGNEEPFRFPWLLRVLGPARASVLVADLGLNRDIPRAKLLLAKVSVMPAPGLELGATWLNQQLGEGAPEASWTTRLVDLLPIPFVVREISERMLGLDARLTLPGRGVEIYLDGVTTDVNAARLNEVLWDEAAWTAGVRFSGLGPGGRLSLRVEGHRNGIRPYTHHHFTSGMTLEGQVIGSPLGPHATSWAAAGTWTGASTVVEAAGAVEWYSGDEYRGNGLDGTRFRWHRISERPDELRRRATLGWRRAGGGFQPAVRVGYERVTRLAFGENGRESFLAEASIGYRW